MPSVAVQSKLTVTMLSVVMQSVIRQSVISQLSFMLSVLIACKIILIVKLLNVVRLVVIFAECCLYWASLYRESVF
jgi:hypothetical protein